MVFAVPQDRKRGSDLIRAASRRGRMSEVISVSKAPRQAAAAAWRNGSFVFHKDHGELARHRDLRLLEAGAFGDPQAPSLQGEKPVCRVRMTLAAS